MGDSGCDGTKVTNFAIFPPHIIWHIPEWHGQEDSWLEWNTIKMTSSFRGQKRRAWFTVATDAHSVEA